MIIRGDKLNLIKQARLEGTLQLKGDSHKSGEPIEKYLSLLRAELGKDDPRYLDTSFGFDWCCAFVYYLVIQSGFKIEIKPLKNSNLTLGLVGVWYEWAIRENRWLNKDHIPEAGDLVLYDKSVSEEKLDHIGIILENHEDHIVTAEGNVNNRTGIFWRSKGMENIRGYIRL